MCAVLTTEHLEPLRAAAATQVAQVAREVAPVQPRAPPHRLHQH